MSTDDKMIKDQKSNNENRKTANAAGKRPVNSARKASAEKSRRPANADKGTRQSHPSASAEGRKAGSYAQATEGGRKKRRTAGVSEGQSSNRSSRQASTVKRENLRGEKSQELNLRTRRSRGVAPSDKMNAHTGDGSMKRRPASVEAAENAEKRRRPAAAESAGKRRRPAAAEVAESAEKRRRPATADTAESLAKRGPTVNAEAAKNTAKRGRPIKPQAAEDSLAGRRTGDGKEALPKRASAAQKGSGKAAKTTGQRIPKRRPEDMIEKPEKQKFSEKAKALTARKAGKKAAKKTRPVVHVDPKKEAMRRKKVMVTYIKTAAVTLAVIAVIMLIWNVIVKPIKKKSAWKAIESSSTTEENLSVATTEAERADGSGQAGCALVSSEKQISYDAPGWQHDDEGWWYACDDSTCYVNGWQTLDDQQYHFNSNGYLDTGWVALGGQGYYFDEDGVYDPNADASKLVALTFDDGPGEYTNHLLDILEENNAVATFFMLGECVEAYGEDVIPRMIEMGCGIGNHSYDHSDMSTLETSECLKQFQTTDDLIGQYNGGQGAEYYRFPYGSYTDEELENINHPSIYWDLDTVDWQIKDATTLAGNIEGDMEGGNIVLMHDIHEWSVEAVGIYLPKMVEQGYQFVTLDELAASRGYSMEPNVTYYGFTDYLVENGSVDDTNRRSSDS